MTNLHYGLEVARLGNPIREISPHIYEDFSIFESLKAWSEK